MGMNTLEIYKALANETRLNIMEWLKEPENHFPPQGLHLPDGCAWTGGVCVGSIQEKAGISQSTVSHYLDILQRAGLLKAERIGKWTYYQRNEETIREFGEYVKSNL